MLNALERLVGGYGPACDHIRQDLAIAESQLRDYQARLGVPFLHDAYLSELTNLRDQLKAGLSGKTPESNSDGQPSVSELAERIKSLKAAHSIEATPQRIRQKQSTAEEPITARIRRRTEAVSVSKPAIAEDQTPSEIPFDHPTIARHGAVKSQMTFQQRLAMERRHRDPEPSLS